MNGKALWVVLEAKPGKEAEVEKFLQAGQGLVEAEPNTVSWFAIKIGPSRYGIFDTFADDSGRDEIIAKEPGLSASSASPKPVQLRFKLRTSLSKAFRNRRPRLRTNRKGPASTKYVSRMLSRVFTSGPTGSAECHVLSATANA